MPDDDTLIATLRLARTENVGPVTFQRLIGIYGNPAAALEALPELSQRGGRKRALKPASRKEAEDELNRTREFGGEYLVWGRDGYPEALAPLPDAPPVLAAYGHTHLLARPSIAIVGARNASATGLKMAEILSEGLSARDFVIVSGLARGIDASAHKFAVENGTIAVLGNGIAHAYPCLLYTSPSPRDATLSRMPSSA